MNTGAVTGGAVDAVTDADENKDEVAGARRVKSAERALTILEILGAAREPMTVTELYARTGYPRSSLHQLLHTMAGVRWIELTADGSAVAIGSRALLVGTAYLDRDAALRRSTRTLEVIREQTGYTTHYARLEGTSIIYLATREAIESHRATSRVGRQLPAHATALGKALLSELTDAEVGAALSGVHLERLTPVTVDSVDALLDQLDATRKRGYAVEREENTPGVSCVAVPIPYRIPATDAISCSVPLDHADDSEITRIADILRSHAATLGAQLRAEGIR